MYIVYHKENDDNFDTLSFSITTPIPVGMTNVMEMNQTASVRNWESVPKSVCDHFNLNKIKKQIMIPINSLCLFPPQVCFLLFI